RNAAKVQFNLLLWKPRGVASHLRRLAEQHLHRHVDNAVAELAVGHDEALIVRKRADNGERAALPLAQRAELRKAMVGDEQDVSFLRFVAPDTERRQPGLGVGYRPDIDSCAKLAVVYGLGHGVRQASGADIVNQQYRIIFTECRTSIDEFLCPPLHLG